MNTLQSHQRPPPSLPLTRIVHENFSIIMCFAFSQRPLRTMVDQSFNGEWKYLNKALFEISAERAEKACLELALFLRAADNYWNISDYDQATKNIPNCGQLLMKDKSERSLPFREVSNKIIHSSHMEWDIYDEKPPFLICHAHSTDNRGWEKASIDLKALAFVCGRLAS